MVEELSDCGEVVEHVGGVGHAETHHYVGVVVELLAEGDEELGDVGVDVAAVGARVLAG